MDWESITAPLLRETRPAIVVDRARRVRLVNAPMLELLGHRVDGARPLAWIALSVPPADRAQVRQLLDAGLRGKATEGSLPIVAAGGKRVILEVEMSRAGRGQARAVVVSVRDVIEGQRPSPPDCDLWCKVGRDHKVHAVRFLDPSHKALDFEGWPLGALLEGVGAAGAEKVVESTQKSATVVVLPRADESFRIVTAQRIEGGGWQITMRCVGADMLTDLVDAKIACVAESSGLSERERQVLTLLLRGRGVEDLATVLDIAPRTVKFHQANVLQKLGADSRLDLLRVVL